MKMKKKYYNKAEEKEEEEENGEKPEDEEEEEEMEEGMKNAKKSEDLNQDDLQKSLERLTSIASEGDRPTRKQTLLEKAMGEALEESEQNELKELLGMGDRADEPSLAEEITKSMDENEDLQKALDVSDYLQENQDELVKSLQGLADHIEKSDNRQHEFNLILAKAVSDIGQHVLGMSNRLGTIEQQPARAPKSKGAMPLQKSFAGSEAKTELSKSQILDGLSSMVQDSVTKGQAGKLADGTDLVMAVAKYEQFNTIAPDLLTQVESHVAKGASAQ